MFAAFQYRGRTLRRVLAALVLTGLALPQFALGTTEQEPFWRQTCANALATPHYSFRNVVAEKWKDQSGKAHYTELLLEEFPSEEEESLITRVISPRVQDGEPYISGRRMPLSPGSWEHQIDSIVEFANSKFDKRRDWGAEFSEKNIKVGHEYRHYSTYAEVLKDGVRVGSVRIISLPLSSGMRIPEFEYLGIDPAPKDATAVTTEIGTFAIEETLDPQTHARVWFELWTQVARAVFGGNIFMSSDPVLMYQQSIHVYADLKSLELYLPLGFKPLKHYLLNGIEKDYRKALNVKSIPPIVKVNDQGHGLKWWPIVLDTADVVRLREKVAAGKTRKISEEQFLKRLPEVVYRDSTLQEFGATFAHCLHFAGSFSAEDATVLGISAGQGVIEGLHEIDLHYEKSLHSDPTSEIYARASANLKSTESRISLFREAMQNWVRSGKDEIAADAAGVYLSGRQHTHHPEILKILIHESFPALLVRASNARQTGISVSTLLAFQALYRALTPQEWLDALKEDSETRLDVHVSPKFVEKLKRALFDPFARNPNTYLLDGAYVELVNTSNLTEAFVRAAFRQAAEQALTP